MSGRGIRGLSDRGSVRRRPTDELLEAIHYGFEEVDNLTRSAFVADTAGIPLAFKQR